MIDLIKKYFTKYKELIMYVFFGGLTTLVNIVSYWLIADVLHVNYLVSTVIAWVISVLFAYVTNKIWVFESKSTKAGEIIKEVALFFAFRALSGLFDLGAMYVMVDLMHINDLIAKIAANVVVIILNYIFSKLVIFKKK